MEVKLQKPMVKGKRKRDLRIHQFAVACGCLVLPLAIYDTNATTATRILMPLVILVLIGRSLGEIKRLMREESCVGPGE